MEHKLIQGGEQYLPFARSRIKALKATGLKYASQKFEIDGVSVKVRIAGEHEYIELSGGETGQYHIFPRNTAKVVGDTGTPPGSKSPNAKIYISAGPKIKANNHTTLVAGLVDWKNWKRGKKRRTVSYDPGGTTRYKLNIGPANTPSTGIYYNGTKHTTPLAVAGAGIFSAVVDGALVERFVYINRLSDTFIQIFAAKIAPIPDWKPIGTSNFSAVVINRFLGGSLPAKTVDPWFFNPDGDKFGSLLSSTSTTGLTTIEKLVVRGSITAAFNSSTGEFDLSATVVIGEKVGKDRSLAVTQAPTAWSYVHGVAGVSPQIMSNVYDITRANLLRANQDDASGFDNLQTQQIRSDLEAVGIDFKPDGQEVIISREFEGYIKDNMRSKSDTRFSGITTLVSSRSYRTGGSMKFFSGQSQMFGVSTENIVSQENKTVLSASPPVYEKKSPMPTLAFRGILVYAIDGRDSSGIFEYFEDSRTGGTSYMLSPFEDFSVDGTAPAWEFKVKSGIQVYYGGELIKDIQLYDVSNGANGFFGTDSPMFAFDPVPWWSGTVQPKFFSEVSDPYGLAELRGSMASAKAGEFVAAINVEKSYFESVVLNTKFNNAEQTLRYASIAAQLAPTKIKETIVFNGAQAAPEQLQKIPLYGTPGFVVDPIKLL